MLNLFILALKCAAIGYVYSVVLTEPDKALNWWYRFLDERIGRRKWLFFPLIHCDECVGGQLALWTYIWIHRHAGYDFGDHVTVIAFSILLVNVIGKIHSWSKLR